jgi:translation initiation factor IF-3
MANPPVCRIMDYGKFRYEESQKAKESRKKTIQVSIKEVKFRPKIGKGDFDTKVRHMQDFLADGHKVKVTLQFRGREMAHPELGSRILDAVIEQVGTHGKVETQARLEGRNMTMVLAPDKKAAVKKSHEPRAHDGKARNAAEKPQQPQQSEQPEQPEQAQAPAEPVSEAVAETADPA